jgi:hypothetical protein
LDGANVDMLANNRTLSVGRMAIDVMPEPAMKIKENALI